MPARREMSEAAAMQVLRVGGEYLTARRHRARAALFAIAGSGVAGATALAVGVHPLAGALLGAGMASVTAKAHRRFGRFKMRIRGERVVTELLRSLPDDYFLLNDVVLPGHPGNVDHVVIGPCGVVVIATRNFTGRVQSDGNARFINGRRSRSVSTQANRAAIAVREALSDAHPDLKESVLLSVESIAAFTNPSRRVRASRAQTIVARYSQLLDVILSIARRKRVPPAVAARLAATLEKMVCTRSTS